MLVTATWNETGDSKIAGRAWSTVEFEVGKEAEVRRIGKGALDVDARHIHGRGMRRVGMSYPPPYAWRRALG